MPGKARGPPAGDASLPALFPLISTISHAQLEQVTVEDGSHFRGTWGNRTPKTSPAVEVVVWGLAGDSKLVSRSSGVGGAGMNGVAGGWGRMDRAGKAGEGQTHFARFSWVPGGEGPAERQNTRLLFTAIYLP